MRHRIPVHLCLSFLQGCQSLYLGPLQSRRTSFSTSLIIFSSNPKERQCQRMFKLPHNCKHLTRQQSNAQNSPSQASTVHEPRTSICSSWIQKRQRNQRSNCQHPFDHQKAIEFQKNIYFFFIDYAKAFNYMDHNQLWNILQEMGIPGPPHEKSVCRSRSNSQNWTWKNRLVLNQERSMSRLYIVTLLI